MGRQIQKYNVALFRRLSKQQALNLLQRYAIFYVTLTLKNLYMAWSASLFSGNLCCFVTDWVIHWFIHSFIDRFIDSFIHSFIHSFIYSFIDWLIDWLIDSVMHSLSECASASVSEWRNKRTSEKWVDEMDRWIDYVGVIMTMSVFGYILWLPIVSPSHVIVKL